MGSMEMPPALSVELRMTPELAAEIAREAGAYEIAKAYTIVGTPEEQALMAHEANEELKRVKARVTYFKERKAKFVEPAKQIIAEAEGLFDPVIAANQGAETFLKQQLGDFTAREQMRIADARRAQEQAERAARQKAEQEAAQLRAKADEEARAKERQAAEAEERRLAAIRDGDAAAAKKAAAEKARLEEQAKAAVENAEVKAQEASLAAASVAVVPAPTTTKLKGLSAREHWVAELAPGVDDAEALRRVVAGLAGVEKFARPELLSLLKLDMPAAGKLATALKAQMNVPGLVAKNKPVTASRAA